jgi:7-cyano-7-deazaguanine synthase
MKKVLCVISGGMDSATLLALAIDQCTDLDDDVEAVSFDYGQRHRKELEYAENLCGSEGVRHDIVDISAIQPHIGGSALTDDGIDVPEGHYESDNMKLTVVPNRNAIMLTIAFGIAVARGAEWVGAAMHAGDHAVYPDCRPAFVQAFNAMQIVAVEGHGHPDLRLWTPFINLKKSHIATIGSNLGVDYSKTWSCYKGQELHCGVCGTCYERREAFRDGGVTDPTIYQQEPVLA